MRRSLVYGVAGATLALAAVLTLLGVGDDPTALTNGQALVLGVVQGATELLPISSSGHLILVPWAAQWTFLEENDRFNQTFDVALHLGTLVAVAAYFWSDLVRLLRAWFRSLAQRRIRTADERIAWFVIVATIPAGIIGLLGEDAIADHLGEPWQILVLLAAGALLLWWADRFPQRRGMGDLGLRHALAMGCAQALALAPGVSRSGITITAGRIMGLDRDSAARFSFLLLLPTVLGAVVLKGVGDVLLGDLPPGWEGPFLVGTLAALGSGLLAIDWLLDYVRRHTYDLFVLYRLVLAAIVLVLILTGLRPPTF
ncbi:MAG: undecaprenyl-diphosphatase UppP, partial [Thermoleophilia bacterium]|nr:undecaprenyl-diphosphatase UppP [Thermoleophilia bacterium]